MVLLVPVGLLRARCRWTAWFRLAPQDVTMIGWLSVCAENTDVATTDRPVQQTVTHASAVSPVAINRS